MFSAIVTCTDRSKLRLFRATVYTKLFRVIDFMANKIDFMANKIKQWHVPPLHKAAFLPCVDLSANNDNRGYSRLDACPYLVKQCGVIRPASMLRPSITSQVQILFTCRSVYRPLTGRAKQHGTHRCLKPAAYSSHSLAHANPA